MDAYEEMIRISRETGVKMDSCQKSYFQKGYITATSAISFMPMASVAEYHQSAMKALYEIDDAQRGAYLKRNRHLWGDFPEFQDLRDDEWYGEKAFLLGFQSRIAEHFREKGQA
jgi:hypothetical protein